MTSSIPDEEEFQPPSPPETDDEPPTGSHRRRWSTPGDSSGSASRSSALPYFSVESLATNSGYDNVDGEGPQGVSADNLDGFFRHSPERRYSFYLGPELSPWGPLAPPFLTESTLDADALERRREKTQTEKEDTPPFLTTLYSNGRPRFRLRRVRSEGRLGITRVAVEEHELIRIRGRGGLRIGTVRNNQEEEQLQERDDKENH